MKASWMPMVSPSIIIAATVATSRPSSCCTGSQIVAADLEGSYDMIMMDALGHGRSGLSADFSIALLADDAAAVIRALQLEKPYLFGTNEEHQAQYGWQWLFDHRAL